MADKKYWKISRVVMVIMRKNMEFITSGRSDTITTSDVFQYVLTAMHDSLNFKYNPTIRKKIILSV